MELCWDLDAVIERLLNFPSNHHAMKLNLTTLSKAELCAMLQELEDSNPGMVSKLVESWNASPQYRAMKLKILAVLNPFLDRGFLARKHVRVIIPQMRKLIDKIENDNDQGHHAKAFWEGMAMIQTWNHQLGDTDDSSGYISPMVDSCWDIVEDAIKLESDPDLRDSFAKYLLNIVKQDSLAEWDWWINPIELLRDMKPGHSIDQELLIALEHPRSKWAEDQLAKTRLELTERVHGKQAADELMASLAHLDSIRILSIEAAVAESDFKRAKSLCLEAVQNENERPWMGNPWMARLLEIAEFEGDKDTQKTALLHLITNDSDSVKERWRKLRPMLTSEEALQLIELITTPDSNNMIDVSRETVVVLLGSEGYQSKLIDFLKRNMSPGSFLLAENYLPDEKESLAELWKLEILDRIDYSYNSQRAPVLADYLKCIVRLVGEEKSRLIKDEILKEHPLKTSLRDRFDEVLS